MVARLIHETDDDGATELQGRVTRAWAPLLAGADADSARDAIAAIAAELREPDPAWQVDASLGTGFAGLAVLYSYLAAVEPDAGHEEVAIRFVERATDGAPPGSSLFYGGTGVAWVIEHLTGWLFDRDDDPGADIERRGIDPSAGFDLSYGAIGTGVYALERGSRELAARVVDVLAHTIDDRGAWPDDTGINLGMSHGAPGAIAFLARSGDPRAPALLDRAVPWLLAQRLPGGSFPALAGEPVPARLGWCYGDAGVALAVHAAARVTDRDDWAREAAAIARGAAARPAETAGVVDAELCHGAIGVAHQLAQLHALIGEAAIAEAARRWYRAGLAMRGTGAIAGYRPVVGEELPFGMTSVGVLTGAAGIALGLLAAVADHPPDWDRVLLISA
jgi:hypothetical protein